MTRRIPPSDWGAFFDCFSRQHDGWLVHLERVHPDRRVEPAGHDLQLRGVAKADPGRRDVVVMLGARGGHLTETVIEPREVRVEESTVGANEALEIVGADGAGLRLRFRSPMPPEMVDGLP